MLRKEELDLTLGLPGRRAVWPVNIVERLDPDVYRLSADCEETPNSTADGHVSSRLSKWAGGCTSGHSLTEYS